MNNKKTAYTRIFSLLRGLVPSFLRLFGEVRYLFSSNSLRLVYLFFKGIGRAFVILRNSGFSAVKQGFTLLQHWLLSCLQLGRTWLLEALVSRWVASVDFVFYLRYISDEDIQDRDVREYANEFLRKWTPLRLARVLERAFRLRQGLKPAVLVFETPAVLHLLQLIHSAIYGFFLLAYRVVYFAVMFIEGVSCWWFSLGGYNQIVLLARLIATLVGLVVFAKLFYWYLIKGYGVLDPLFWGYELLEHLYAHRQYGAWANIFSSYMITLVLIIPVTTYIILWHYGLWLMDFDYECVVRRPYPYTELELSLGLSMESLFLLIWGWVMNILAISHETWYGPSDDVDGPYDITAWGAKPVKIEYGFDWWLSWTHIPIQAFYRLENFFEWQEYLNIMRGPVSYLAKYEINDKYAAEVGFRLFRRGDFFMFTPGWRSTWDGGRWKRQPQWGTWCFPKSASPGLTDDQRQTLMYSLYGRERLQSHGISPNAPKVVAFMEDFAKERHLSTLPEEHLYGLLGYSVAYARMNHSVLDYGKRPDYLADSWGTLAGDIYLSTFIGRPRPGVACWETGMANEAIKERPIFDILESHSVFRRCCFHYGIALDYRDWTPLNFLRKTALDDSSWGSFWAKLVQLPEVEDAYYLKGDPFLFAWLHAPTVRRHFPLGYGRMDRMHISVSHKSHIDQSFVVAPHSFMYDTVTECQLISGGTA